jgi:hypothetical protein
VVAPVILADGKGVRVSYRYEILARRDPSMLRHILNLPGVTNSFVPNQHAVGLTCLNYPLRR